MGSFFIRGLYIFLIGISGTSSKNVSNSFAYMDITLPTTTTTNTASYSQQIITPTNNETTYTPGSISTTLTSEIDTIITMTFSPERIQRSTLSKLPIVKEAATPTVMESINAATFTPEITTTTPTSYFLGLENVTWHPTSTEEILVYTDVGYKIVVTITDCSFEENDFANFSTGKYGETVLVSRYLIQKSSVLYNNNLLHATFTGTSASNLTVLFYRVEEEFTTTTTEVPSSTIFLPTPSVNDSDEVSVHLTGLDPYLYRQYDVLIALKEMIASMASDYCQKNNFELIDEITANNVQKMEIKKCTNGWPTCNPCVEMIFAVPINMKENEVWSGYQLNSSHLRTMWDTYSNEYLRNLSLGIATCEQPNINNWIKWNIIVILSVTVAIFLLLLILRFILNRFAKRAAISNRKLNDKSPVISFEEIDEEIELPPHYLQEMPNLFDNAYTTYNPDIGKANPGFEHSTEDLPLETEDINEDESDSDIGESFG